MPLTKEQLQKDGSIIRSIHYFRQVRNNQYENHITQKDVLR